MADDTNPPADDAEVDGAAPIEVAPELLYDVPVERNGDQTVLFPTTDTYVATVEAARSDGYFMCLDLCGVDYLDYTSERNLPEGISPERFEVVVTLINHREAKRIRLRVQLPAENPTITSLFGVHPGVDAMEREAYDMFGFSFEGHPQLSRILMPDDWSGHPLRKDYSIGRIPVQFKEPAGR